ncbi:BnaAnng24860D [Brassica napus]|uniref:BnaAnng24860D protein n=1 Tax=Brassica napus TaxID=3708 RepID=A0A078JMG4_BRANA|nr:BnaAnng24860D [Brassica napus]
MGEDDTIGFEAYDYPIPTDDLDPVFGDILKALHAMGFRNGYIDVYLYSEQINCEAIVTDDFLGQGEYYCAFGYKVLDITLYMIRRATCIGPGPVNYFVIAKPKRELHRVLQCLKSRRHNVLLVKPPPPGEKFLFSVASLLENARFLGGGKPRFKELYASHASEYDISFEKYVEIKEDVSKMVDFSGVLVIILLSGPILMMLTRKGLPYWVVTRRGLPESTFFPESFETAFCILKFFF